MHAQQTYTIKVKHSSILQLIGMDHQVVCYVVLLLLLQLHAQHLLSLSLSVSLGGSERQVPPPPLLSRRVPPPPYYYLDTYQLPPYYSDCYYYARHWLTDVKI